jgi:hypothetical protein
MEDDGNVTVRLLYVLVRVDLESMSVDRCGWL